MPTIGRKPAERDISWAWINQNQARASIMGRVSANGWLVNVGGRCGRQGSTSPTTYYGVYQASGSSVTTRLGITNSFKASTVMLDHWSGANYVAKTPTPLMVRPGVDYALAILMTGAAGAVGQDVSGHVMHTRNGISALPSPYNASTSAPEGKLSLWADIVNNRAPNLPGSLSPSNGSMITTSKPTLGASFSDPDEVLTGYSVGQADKMKSYQFEVWNSAKTSRLRNSGKINASSAQQSARRATWAVPTSLPADRYIARVTMWDMFDTPSRTAEWTFTINAGGVYEDVGLRPSQYVGGGIVNGDGSSSSLTARATWTHQNGLAASNFQIQLKNASGAVVRGPSTLSGSVANGSMREWHFSSAGWAALPRGQRYRLEARGQDTAGLWSPWAASALFMVNAPPNGASSRSPVNTASSSRPTLSATVTDPNDNASTLSVEFAIRSSSSTGSGSIVPASRTSYSGGKWTASPDATEIPGYGGYEWRVRAIDPWGLEGAWSTWLSFTYASPPTVAVSSPTGVISTGTPVISFTVSQAMSRYRLVIARASTGAAVLDVTINAGGTSASYTVPTGILRGGIDYRATVTVTATTGLTGSGASTFRVQYPAIDPVDGLSTAIVPGPYEPDADPSQWSRIQVSWNPVSETVVDDNEFTGYIVRRIDLGTGDETVVAHILTRQTSIFIDKTATSDVAYRYDVTYLATRNLLDIVESSVVSVFASVTLVNTVVTSLDGDDLGAPLRFWDGRGDEWQMDREVVPTWGERPVIFSGASSYSVISGDFIAIDDEHGTYTAQEIVRALRAMASNIRYDNGAIAPRALYYRDPRGRSLAVVMTAGGEDDRHETNVGTMHLVFTEVSATIGIDDADLPTGS